MHPFKALQPALLGAALAVGSAGAQQVMTPGGWEMTGTITRELSGKPQESMGTMVLKTCLTPEFLARDPYLNPKLGEDKVTARGATCNSSEYERDANTATWVMRCELQDGSRLKARFRHTAQATSLTQRMEQEVERPGGGKGLVVINTVSRHIGPCTDDMPRP